MIKDLQTVKANCSANIYQYDGKKNIVNLGYNHKNQNNFAYSNQMQKKMLSSLIQEKPKMKWLCLKIVSFKIHKY